jgi:hypothetical protein
MEVRVVVGDVDSVRITFGGVRGAVWDARVSRTQYFCSFVFSYAKERKKEKRQESKDQESKRKGKVRQVKPKGVLHTS